MKFLSDSTPDNDELKTHKPIALALVKHVETKYKGSFVIGLFGKWGTGKTSIMDWFEQSITTNKDVAYAKLDAWKSGEKFFAVSFVRALIHQCVAKDDRNSLLKEIGTKSTARTTTPDIKHAKGLWVILLSLFATLSFLLPNLYIFADSDFPWISMASFVFGGGIILLGQYYLTNLSVKTDVIEEDISLEQGDRFQKVLIEDLLPKIKEPICCVLVDNIDRLEAKEALDVIRKLKTYIVDESKLNKIEKKLIIIVPVDDRILVNYIEKDTQLDRDFQSGRQFIRKFFNISLRVPLSVRPDMYHVTRQMLREAYDKEPLPHDLDDIAYVFNRAANNNPRDIKTLVNEFVSFMLLLQSREEEEIIESIVSNPLWLAYFVSFGSLSNSTNMPTQLTLLDDKDKFDVAEFAEGEANEKRMIEFVASTTDLRSSIPQAAWQWLIYHKISESLSLFPSFIEIYDRVGANDAPAVWELIKDLEDSKKKVLLERLVIESPGEDNALVSICATAVNLTNLQMKKGAIPGIVLRALENLLQKQKGTSALVTGQLVNVIDLISRQAIEAAIESVRLATKAHAESENPEEFDPEGALPGWLEFSSRYLKIRQSDERLPGIPSSALQNQIRFYKPIAVQLSLTPNTLNEKTASALAERLTVDDGLIEEKRAFEFFDKLSEGAKLGFSKTFFTIYNSKITGTKTAEPVFSRSFYILGIKIISAVDSSQWPEAEINGLLNNAIEHISTRNDADLSLLALMGINALKAANTTEGVKNQVSSIQNQLGAGIYTNSKKETLAKVIREFPDIFRTLPENHLKQIAQIDQEFFNFVSELDVPFRRNLLQTSLNWWKSIITQNPNEAEIHDFLAAVIEKGESEGYIADAYVSLKGLKKGKYPLKLRKLIWSHYKDIISASDLSVPNQVLNLAKVINHFRVTPSRDQKDEIEAALNNTSGVGFADEKTKLRKVLHGSFVETL